MALPKMRSLRRRETKPPIRPVGHALVVHRPDGMTAEAGVLAESLPADPECALVVVDLPVDGQTWESIAAAVPADGRAVRLVPCGEVSQVILPAAQLLSEGLGRTVFAPDGAVRTGSRGVSFLPANRSKGWARCTPGDEPVWAGRRYPVPSWESPAVTSPSGTGGIGVVEPLPAGVWIRPDGPERYLDGGRVRLARWLCFQPDVLTVVLGGHGTPPLPLEDVARWWASVPPPTRAITRFVCYGPAVTPEGTAPGQALADTLDEEIVCYNGLPVGPPGAPDVFVLRPDGSHGVRTFAEQIAYRPRGQGASGSAAPVIRRARKPLDDLAEVAPGVYRHSSGAAVEIVQAGLWIRSPRDVTRATLVRSRPADPDALVIFHDADGEERAERMRATALDLLKRLERPGRSMVRIVETTSLEGFGPPPSEVVPDSEVDPGLDRTTPLVRLPRLAKLLRKGAAEEAAGDAAHSDPSLSTVRIEYPAASAKTAEIVQPVPAPRLRVWPLGPEFVPEPDVVRAGREDEFDAWSERIKAGRELPEDVVTVAVAAGLYLSGHDPEVDAGLRTATDGPHVAFGRHVAAGLASLPPYRKAAMSVVMPTEAQWEALRGEPVLREWGFLHLITESCAVDDDATELLVWSMTGRRTALIEPAGEGVTGRVVFLPGTPFKVIEATEPGDGERGRILMRELTAAEFDDGAQGSGSLDEVVRTSLLRFAGQVSEPGVGIPDTQSSRFRRLPGML
ncbi:hypothetical protein [Amycolatopsis pigmentata]|uniref:Uncharacterized protein n=1 Tax=Amycolatopsis pigmentata TaxID=450801 RepID=A0ABW5G073_9PSEU